MTFFCQIWSQDSLRHLLGPLEVNFDICQFLVTPGPFEYFGQNQGSSESQCFLNEGAMGHPRRSSGSAPVDPSSGSTQLGFGSSFEIVFYHLFCTWLGFLCVFDFFKCSPKITLLFEIKDGFQFNIRSSFIQFYPFC